MMHLKPALTSLATTALVFGTGTAQAADKIVHDAEYYILKAQHRKQWAADNRAVDAKLEEFRKKSGGKPPNILYILIDDVGFGLWSFSLGGRWT